MNKRGYLVVGMAALGAAGIAVGQGRIMDMVADKVISKYQSTSCEQLWQQKGQPKSPGAEGRSLPEERSAGARRVPEQGGRTDCQQDVRMRDDSVIVRGALPR